MQPPPGPPFQPPGQGYAPQGQPVPQQQTYGAPPAASSAAAASKGKKIAGCGGCGCALALLFLIAGVALYIGGTTESAWTEMVPFGYALSGLSVPVGIIAAAVLIWGIVALQKAKKG